MLLYTPIHFILLSLLLIGTSSMGLFRCTGRKKQVYGNQCHGLRMIVVDITINEGGGNPVRPGASYAYYKGVDANTILPLYTSNIPIYCASGCVSVNEVIYLNRGQNNVQASANNPYQSRYRKQPPDQRQAYNLTQNPLRVQLPSQTRSFSVVQDNNFQFVNHAERYSQAQHQANPNNHKQPLPKAQPRY